MACEIESIHNHLRSLASHRPEETERLVCETVQLCCDRLKGFQAQSGGRFGKAVKKELQETTFEIAVECGWLPPEVHTSDPVWRKWIHEALAGCFSEVGVGWNPQGYHPHVFVPFPTSTRSRTETGQPAPGDRASVRESVVNPILLKKGWSVLKWADKANVDPHTAYGYLAGKTNPYSSTRKKLAGALELDVEDLPR